MQSTNLADCSLTPRLPSFGRPTQEFKDMRFMLVRLYLGEAVRIALIQHHRHDHQDHQQ